MIHAYGEMYVSSAQAILGEAFDYAVNDCKLQGENFVRFFVAGTVARRMENGEAMFLAGKSGIEVAAMVIEEATGRRPEVAATPRMSRTADYWIGWAVAYYQWFSGNSYQRIFSALTYAELERMYPTLHEADLTKFIEIADEVVREKFPETNLKRLRTLYGCTQKELATRSGVSLRSIQMYEQRQKDINKASLETVLRISKVLGCTMEDLVER